MNPRFTEDLYRYFLFRHAEDTILCIKSFGSRNNIKNLEPNCGSIT